MFILLFNYLLLDQIVHNSCDSENNEIGHAIASSMLRGRHLLYAIVVKIRVRRINVLI